MGYQTYEKSCQFHQCKQYHAALYPYAKIHKRISQALAIRQIPALDLLQSFSDTRIAADHWNLDIWHPNTRGHAFIAQSIAPFVLAKE